MKCKLPIKQIKMKEVSRGGGLEFGLTELCFPSPGPGGGDTPYNGLYGEAPPERGTFFRLQV